MIAVLIGAGVALIVALVGTPLVISYFRQRGFGQPIRDEGPQSHQSKAGTPTMGGTAIVLAAVIGYGVAHLGTASISLAGLLVLSTFVGMAVVGFADDLIKLRMRRNLGLNKTTKFAGQAPADPQGPNQRLTGRGLRSRLRCHDRFVGSLVDGNRVHIKSQAASHQKISFIV
ncbi:MAG: hypothetical protein R6U94_04625, partial [Nitriliruptoraceae bacterium]